jgi:hypothetical protein
LRYNGMHQYTLWNADTTPLTQLPGPYDLIYSFYAIGFHWSLEHFLEDILGLMHDGSIGIFTLSYNFKPFPRLEQLLHRIVRQGDVIDQHQGWLRLLLLGKSKGAEQMLFP